MLIGDGRIGLGVRLPSERELTGALDVSRTTVTRAYEVLREAGYAEARRGSGTFTTVPGGQRRAHDRALLPGTGGEDVIDLNCAAHSRAARARGGLPARDRGAAGLPQRARLLPARRARRCRRGSPRRTTPAGCRPRPSRSWSPPARSPRRRSSRRPSPRTGDRVVVESPTYPNATQAVRHAGARLVPAAVDPDGWDLDALAATLRQSSPRLAYLIPDFQNPTGHLMSRRAARGARRRAGPHPHGRGRRRGPPGARAHARARGGDAAAAGGVRRRRDHHRQREQVLLGRAAPGLGARAARRDGPADPRPHRPRPRRAGLRAARAART